MKVVLQAAAIVLLVLIRGYQLLISPLFPPSCRYMPSCSEYARQAVRRHGPLAGGWLAARRLARCHPWGGFGYDPVPDAASTAPCPCGGRHSLEHPTGR